MRRGLMLAGLQLACALALSFNAQAQSSIGAGISLESFLAELSRLSDEIGALDSSESAERITATIPPRWRVNVDGGAIEVDARWITVALDDARRGTTRWDATRRAIRERLARLRAESSSRQHSASHANARAALTTILQRDEFQQSAASRWRERLQQRVGEWLEDLWSRLGGGSDAGRRVALVLAWLAALGAFVGLVFVLARAMAERPRHAVLNLGQRGPLRPRARELALRALHAARDGNGREAVRLAYGAAVIKLEEQGAWRVDDARTPREYLQLLRSNDVHRTLMLDLTRRFERIWYGNRPVEPDDALRATAQLEELGCLRPGERVI
jgi:Domain of unknown function (DUF4129)